MIRVRRLFFLETLRISLNAVNKIILKARMGEPKAN